MTPTIFIGFLVTFSLISSLITEAVKKATKATISNNLTVAIIAVIVGWGGGAIGYVFLNIPFDNIQNIICLVLFAPCCWLGAMVGYDKVIQTIKQIINVSNVKKALAEEKAAKEAEAKEEEAPVEEATEEEVKSE